MIRTGLEVDDARAYKPKANRNGRTLDNLDSSLEEFAAGQGKTSLGDSAFETMGSTVQNSLSHLSYGQFSDHVTLVKKPAITGSFELQQRGHTGTGAFEAPYLASPQAAAHVRGVSGDTVSTGFAAAAPAPYDSQPKASYQTTTNAVRDQQPDYGEVDGVDPQMNIRARRGG